MTDPASDPGRRLALSSGQERLWLLHQLHAGSDYNVRLAIRFATLAAKPLERALNALVARHSELRAVFTAAPDGRPVKSIVDDFRIPLARLRVGPDEDWRVPAGTSAVQPFDLAAGPPVRGAVIECADGSAVLCLVMHHIVVDGPALRLIERDIAELYRAEAAGRAPELPPLPAGYDEFVTGQRGHDTAGQLAYWREELDGSEPLHLPLDRPRPARPGEAGATLDFALSVDQTTELLATARRLRCAPTSFLAGITMILLSVYSGQDDITIGSVVNGRDAAGFDDVVGFFVNTVVLRAAVPPDASCRSVLRAVHGKVSGAHAHQDVPFDEVVAAVGPQRVAGRNPLFDVVFVHHGDATTGAHGDDIARVPWADDASRFDLELATGLEHGRLTGTFTYRTELFGRATIEGLARTFARIVACVLADPDRTIGELVLADETQPAGAPVLAYPGRALGALFEDVVDRTPDATAVLAGGERLSYTELDRRANGLAHRLTAGDVVAVLAERSTDLVVAMIAIAKAGAVFLPLRPADPVARTSTLLHAAGATTLLATADLAAHPVTTDTTTVLIAGPDTAKRPDRPVDPEQFAYILYTSGSTGEPKGVAVPHRAVTELAADRRWRTGGPMRVLNHSPHTFDASVFEIWVPLLTGGQVVLAPPGLLTPDVLADVARTTRLTHVWLTAELFRVFAEERPDVFAGIGQVWTGGDVVAPTAVAAVLEHCPDTRVVDGYGPTETTTFATAHDIRPPLGTTIPIGQSLDNTRCHVLGSALQPLPAGAVGELFIAGTGLAHGYLDRSDLTAERFLPDPYGPPGSRMYRTGDLARVRDDGVIEFLGRADDQVKIRGFRVETGEIAAVLAEHPGVRQLAVVARSDDARQLRLACYVCWRDGAAPDLAGLRRFATDRLPDYLVPADFVTMAELPLGPTGKLDRRRLPAPRRDEPAPDTRAARTPREDVLRTVFADVLGRPSVGVDDDFFAQGGHSLLAMRVVSRVRAVLGVELTVRAVFDHPTAAGLAAVLDHGDVSRAPLTPRPRPTELPLSFAQQRLWFLHQVNGPDPTYNVPIAMRLSGELDVAALTAAVEDVLTRHETLRTTFPLVAGRPVQVVGPATVVPEFVHIDEPGLQTAMDRAARHAFDLTSEPPVRLWLFELGPADHAMLLLVHHIACDGASLGPLSRDLAAAYAARRRGHTPDWSPLPVQYADYGLWQRELLGSDEQPTPLAARQADHWRHALAALPTELPLPTDRRRPATPSGAGGRVNVHIGPERFARLRAVADRAQASMYMVLQAGLAILLSKLTGATDIPLGGVVAGRTEAELDDLVGFFVNTQVLRYDVSADRTFAELLGHVREVDLAAYDNQDLAFERIVEIVAPPRMLARHPLFQVMLAYQSQDDGQFALDGLTVHPMTADVATAKFDLNLMFTELPDRRGVNGILEYSADLFDRPTVTRIADQLLLLLDRLAAAPDRPVAHIGLVADADIARLAAWNATDVDLPAATLTDLLDEQAARTPDAEAVVFRDTFLTYAELDGRAEQLAAALSALGAAPGRFVVVSLPRSLDLVVALLAVLKTGAAYVPIDVDAPLQRRAMMLADVAPVAVLDEQFAVTAGTGHRHRPTPADAAYVIHTSGSTGRPKGVVVTHEAIANRLRWMQAEFGLRADDRVLQKTPFTFDVSVWEFFWPLITGATLVVAEPDGHRDPAYLASVLRTQRITTVHFVPSMLLASLDELAAAPPTALRRVICSGEALPPSLQQRCFDLLPAPLYNLYGPTEAAVDVTSWRCVPGAEPTTVPIGRPVWNTQAHVLDPVLHPVPVGVAGELYLAGVQLARGYLGQPALTAASFVANPFGPPGSRLYRTGDLARWTEEGELVYLGRADRQVKIRGVRVELDEVRAALAGHPAVDHAEVAVHTTEAGEQRVVAYVVPGAAAAAVRLLAGWERRGEIDGLPRHVLPNGMVVLGRQRSEIDFLYQEIFQHREYLRHGVTVPPGAVVFDVGAHVGMFALFVASCAPDAVVYAFEPIPDLQRELARNLRLAGVRSHVFHSGLGAERGTAEFTYYPQLSILSGRFADAAEERQLVGSHAARLVESAADRDTLVDAVGDLVVERLRDRQLVTGDLTTLSDVIDEHDVARIDLLKIDAEKSELEVLRGIRAEHWPRVQQVVAEVHDTAGRLAEITGLLTGQGFTVHTEIASALEGSGLVNVFAVRAAVAPEPTPEPAAGRWFDGGRLADDLRRTVRQRLPEVMRPADYVFLDELPLSANGKLDHRALPAPHRPRSTSRRAPGTAQEELLCGLMATVLGVERVGVDDDFFDLGGHSLLAARLVRAVASATGADLPIGAVFRAPTAARLAALLGDGDTPGAADPLLPIRAHGESSPVFFVHPGIGLSLCYTGFGRHLPDRPLYGLQATPESPGDLTTMAADYVDRIRTIQPRGPYHLAGWSFGGNVAHAMAARLATLGEQVGLLALLDAYPYAGETPATGPAAAAPPPDLAEVRRRHLGQWEGLSDARVAELAGFLARHDDLARRHDPAVVHADVLFFRARGHADTAALRPDAWRPFVTGEIRVHDIPAGHHELLDPRPLARIGRLLAAELEVRG